MLTGPLPILRQDDLAGLRQARRLRAGAGAAEPALHLRSQCPATASGAHPVLAQGALTGRAHGGVVTMNDGTAEAWDAAYAGGEDSRSWYESVPAMSLRMLDRAGVSTGDSVVDVGGGTARLVDALLEAGFGDLAVVDLSSTALAISRRRLGAAARKVRWLRVDVCEWRPERTYRVWHDRAVFHFMTTDEGRERYVAALRAGTGIGSVAVIGCFAPDGPKMCSGLPVARYDAEGLAETLGADWELVAADRELHRTPWDSEQPLTWAALRRQG